MIIDASLVLSSVQAITVTAPSSNYVDTLAAGDSYEGQWVVFRVDTAFTAVGAATLQIDLQTDSDPAFGTATVLATLGTTVAKATLIKGYMLKLRIPPGAKRYLRGNYTVATGPMTAGKADLFMVENADLALV